VTLTDLISQADLTFTVSVYQDSGLTILKATSSTVNLASPSGPVAIGTGITIGGGITIG
jgi:hypothetical protein